MVNYLRLLRCDQWVKNIIVLFPLFFGHKITDPVLLLRCIVAALLFCLVASAVYCFNDVCDREIDRRHPLKCQRPVAAGVISVRTAFMVMIGALLVVASFCVVAPLVSPLFDHFIQLLPLFAFYLLLNIAYSLWLKHVAVVDVLVLAAFYVIRLYVGSMATGIVNSRWIVLMTFLLALLLGIGKRRDDIMRHRCCHGCGGWRHHRMLHHVYDVGGCDDECGQRLPFHHEHLCDSGGVALPSTGYHQGGEWRPLKAASHRPFPAYLRVVLDMLFPLLHLSLNE